MQLHTGYSSFRQSTLIIAYNIFIIITHVHGYFFIERNRKLQWWCRCWRNKCLRQMTGFNIFLMGEVLIKQKKIADFWILISYKLSSYFMKFEVRVKYRLTLPKQFNNKISIFKFIFKNKSIFILYLQVLNKPFTQLSPASNL